VTFSAIREAIKQTDGVSISTNTIQRNDLAYAAYQRYASIRPSARAGIDRSPRCWTAHQPPSAPRCGRRLPDSVAPQRTN
jgi:hypothetical protein